MIHNGYSVQANQKIDVKDERIQNETSQNIMSSSEQNKTNLHKEYKQKTETFLVCG